MQINAETFALRELPVDLPMEPWPVAIVTFKNRTLNPSVRLFIELARKVAKSIEVRQTIRNQMPKRVTRTRVVEAGPLERGR